MHDSRYKRVPEMNPRAVVYNVPVEAHGMMFHIRVIVNVEGVAGTDGKHAAVFFFSSDHMCMLRFPGVGHIIMRMHLLWLDACGASVSKSQYDLFKAELWKGGGMTDAELHEAIGMFLKEREAAGEFAE
jgi:hypothetical protein